MYLSNSPGGGSEVGISSSHACSAGRDLYTSCIAGNKEDKLSQILRLESHT